MVNKNVPRLENAKSTQTETQKDTKNKNHRDEKQAERGN